MALCPIPCGAGRQEPVAAIPTEVFLPAEMYWQASPSCSLCSLRLFADFVIRRPASLLLGKGSQACSILRGHWQLHLRGAASAWYRENMHRPQLSAHSRLTMNQVLFLNVWLLDEQF